MQISITIFNFICYYKLLFSTISNINMQITFVKEFRLFLLQIRKIIHYTHNFSNKLFKYRYLIGHYRGPL